MNDVKVYDWYYPDAEMVSVHEAGHAYMCWKEGVKISSVFITKPYLQHKEYPRQPEGGVNIKGGWVYDKKVATSQFKIALAGMAAEEVFLGGIEEEGCKYDMTLANDMKNLFQLDEEKLKAETFKEVKAAAPHIAEFASVLAKKRRLTGKQVVRTFKRICSEPKGI